MQTPTSGIPRSPQQAINTMSPGDRRVLNENELALNRNLTERVVHDLNREPTLPFDSAGFDAVLVFAELDPKLLASLQE